MFLTYARIVIAVQCFEAWLIAEADLFQFESMLHLCIRNAVDDVERRKCHQTLIQCGHGAKQMESSQVPYFGIRNHLEENKTTVRNV